MDSNPRLGTAWEKGERLAKLIAHRRTLLILDGLEPLQNPPGPQEGRLREPSLQALLRELAALNTGLCVITTRLPVADIADHEGASASRLDLEQLSSEAGARLLRALSAKGDEAELRTASDEFSGGFCAHRATCLKVDGKDIIVLNLILNGDSNAKNETGPSKGPKTEK